MRASLGIDSYFCVNTFLWKKEGGFKKFQYNTKKNWHFTPLCFLRLRKIWIEIGVTHVLGFQKNLLRSLSIDVEKGIAGHFVKKKKKKDFFFKFKKKKFFLISKERGTVCVRDSQPGYLLLRFVHRPWMKRLAKGESGWSNSEMTTRTGIKSVKSDLQ